jgi:hypothetical protein
LTGWTKKSALKSRLICSSKGVSRFASCYVDARFDDPENTEATNRSVRMALVQAGGNRDLHGDEKIALNYF